MRIMPVVDTCLFKGLIPLLPTRKQDKHRVPVSRVKADSMRLVISFANEILNCSVIHLSLSFLHQCYPDDTRGLAYYLAAKGSGVEM